MLKKNMSENIVMPSAPMAGSEVRIIGPDF